MRRALGTTTVLIAAVALGGFELGLGCSHDTKPVVQPDDHPPLPPASGTPIGYLVDDAGELKLTDDQLTRLKAIDEELAAKLATLDTELRGASPAAGSGQPRGRRRRGGGAGGGGFGGAGGGGRRGGMRGGGAGSGTGSAQPRPAGGASADTVNRVTETRAADVRDAIDRALALLDVVQRVMAKRVLTDHGVDLDAGRPTARAAGAARPGEPDEPAEPGDAEPGPTEPPGAGSGSG